MRCIVLSNSLLLAFWSAKNLRISDIAFLSSGSRLRAFRAPLISGAGTGAEKEDELSTVVWFFRADPNLPDEVLSSLITLLVRIDGS